MSQLAITKVSLRRYGRNATLRSDRLIPNYPTILPDYQVAESFKLDLDYNDENSDFRKTTFPARYIYERLLPSVVEKFSDIHYHRSSPYSGFGKPTTDKTVGDIHQCK